MKSNRLLWIPRVLAIIFILFISLFALDAFSGKVPFAKQLVAFLIHLIPSYILVIILIISWKKPLIGGIVFIFLGIVALTFIITQFFIVAPAYSRTNLIFIFFLILSLPLLVVGVLFIIFNRKRI